MILRTSYDGDQESTVISTDPNESDIAHALQSMDWNRFAFVTLFEDEHNWLDGSGCLEPGFGLSMMLSVDGILYVTETAPPSPDSMQDAFNAYLRGDHAQLFALIYDAPRRGLNPQEIERLRGEDETRQRNLMADAAVAEAAHLFAKKDYPGFVQKIEPFERWLGPADAKKLSLARKKARDVQE
jgi:hypothetical protein